MIRSFMIAIYAIEMILMLLYIYNFNKKHNYSPVFNGLAFAFLAYYLIVPILIMINLEQLIAVESLKGRYNSSTFTRFIKDGTELDFLYGNFNVCLCALFFTISYKHIRIHNFVNRNYLIILMKRFGLITFVIGMPSLLLFFRAFGGIGVALSYGEILRNMSNSTVAIIGSYALLKVVGRLVTVASILFYGLIIYGMKAVGYKVLFAISFVFSMLFFLYNAGRAPIIEFVLMFAYERMVNRFHFKRPWTMILITGIIGLPILDLLDAIFVYFQTGTFYMGSPSIYNYITQFSTPFKNTLILNKFSHEYGFRYGTDFITGVLNLLPGVQFNLPFNDLSEYVRGSSWRSLGGVPTDFITFCHMEFCFIGVAFFSFLMGMVAKKIDGQITQISNTKLQPFMGAVLTISFASIVGFTDVSSILMGGFILTIVSFVVILSSGRLVFGSRRNNKI